MEKLIRRSRSRLRHSPIHPLRRAYPTLAKIGYLRPGIPRPFICDGARRLGGALGLSGGTITLFFRNLTRECCAKDFFGTPLFGGRLGSGAPENFTTDRGRGAFNETTLSSTAGPIGEGPRPIENFLEFGRILHFCWPHLRQILHGSSGRWGLQSHKFWCGWDH